MKWLLVALMLTGQASFYSTEACKIWERKGVYDCPTASGKSLYQLERNNVSYAAIWGYPFGTRMRITNISNQKSVIVTIYDRGPARRLNRVIDLSRQAFSQISNIRQGLINVTVEVL